ncbi:MAG: hypothetical protein MJK10_15095 [Pseudomonadales bacterium]|nr:hypothetical protein [Pseudomonadales bacterium]NRA17342.1 flagellar biosynthesis protein FliC [Oceanospirillaceae bacterium]
MAMVINSNIQSLNAQRHLSNSLQEQNTATERLSSGLRINSAKDDAAGLAIANRMTSQIQGLNQAVRNANDGAALIQTAEGGLEEVTNILQRMRELSIQSANGTYDTGNRDTLNAEVKQLQEEINRIGESTSFNGLNILDGSQGEIKLQVGENANQTIAMEITEVSTKSLGTGVGADIIGEVGVGTLLVNLQTITDTSAAATTGTKINGIKLDVGSLATANYNLEDALSDINTQLGGSVIAGSLVEVQADSKGDGILSGTDRLTVDIIAADGTATQLQIENTTGLQDLVDKINEKSNGEVTAELDSNGNFMISGEGIASIALTHSTGADIDETIGDNITSGAVNAARLTLAEGTSTNGISIDYGTSAPAFSEQIGIDQRLTAGRVEGGSGGTLADIDHGKVVINGVELNAYDNTIDYDKGTTATAGEFNDVAAWMNLQSDETGVIASANSTTSRITLEAVDGQELSFQYAGDATDVTANKAILDLQEVNDNESAGANVDSIDISTAAGAQRAISILDDAISQVSESRGELGAVSNRLDYTTRNLSNISENASSARSAIMDADFAAESANLSRAQVLQQAGNAMLAQANARPQQVLSLLQ